MIDPWRDQLIAELDRLSLQQEDLDLWAALIDDRGSLRAEAVDRHRRELAVFYQALASFEREHGPLRA